jgi:hypothetical protein
MKLSPKSILDLVTSLFIFSGLGCIAGAGVGFFVFLRLGLPKESEHLIGHVSSLFVGAGLEFGISLWALHVIFFCLLQSWSVGYSCASSYHFKNMDLGSGDTVASLQVNKTSVNDRDSQISLAQPSRGPSGC